MNTRKILAYIRLSNGPTYPDCNVKGPTLPPKHIGQRARRYSLGRSLDSGLGNGLCTLCVSSNFARFDPMLLLSLSLSEASSGGEGGLGPSVVVTSGALQETLLT